jgi:hypothetical protein
MSALEIPQGDPVARAKRTERADARRRYRVAQADEASPEEMASAGTSGAAATGASRTGRTGSQSPTEPQRPPSFTGAFRAAARPLNVRDDLSYLPQLIKSRAVWLPVLASTAAGILMVAVGTTNSLINFAAQILVVPPPMAVSFLAGLLATRASYLAGGIAGLWASLVFTAVVFLLPSSSELPVTATDRVSVAFYGLVVSPLFGVAVGGFAGYYRRFLAVSSPQRRRQQEQARAAKSRQKAAASRR